MISKVIYDADIDDFFFFYSETKKNLFRDEARDEMKGERRAADSPTVYVAREFPGRTRQAIALDRSVNVTAPGQRPPVASSISGQIETAIYELWISCFFYKFVFCKWTNNRNLLKLHK